MVTLRRRALVEMGRLAALVAALGLLACDKSDGGSASDPKPGTATESKTAKGADGDEDGKSAGRDGDDGDSKTAPGEPKRPAPDLYDEPVERRLHTDRLEASSFLWTDWNRFQENYHPNYIADGDPKTAWVEGADNSGQGSWIRLHVSKVEGATRVRLRLRNGYHKSKSLFKKNARAKAIRIQTLPGGHVHEATLSDSMDWQQVELEQPKGPLDAIQITVDSVYEGSKYTDLCLSDVELFVTGLTKENPAFEKARLEKILNWKQQRVAMARAFESGKNKNLPVAPGYRVETVGDQNQGAESDIGAWLDRAAGKLEAESAIARAKKAVDSKFEGWKPVDHAIADRRPIPEVDGLYHAYADELVYSYAREDAFMLPAVDDVSVLTGVGLSLFGAKRSFGPNEVSGDDCPADKTFMWRPPGDDGPRMSQLLIVSCAEAEERDGRYVRPVLQLLGFDDHGRLILFASDAGVSSFQWDGAGSDARIASGTRVASAGVSRLEIAGK